MSNQSYHSWHDTYHLLSYHHDCFGREPPVTVIKKVFERGAEEVDDEDVV